MSISRRNFLLTSVAMMSAALTGCAQSRVEASKPDARGGAARVPRRLIAETRSIEVNGRTATMLGVRQTDGTRGLVLEPGERFDVELENRLNGPTIVHWHGQMPPPEQDGVTQFGESDLQPGERRRYDFVPRQGTFWMHSHHGFQEQWLLAAPLIIRTPDDVRADRQEVTIFLQDFTFRDPQEIMAELRRGSASGAAPTTLSSATHSAAAGMAHMEVMQEMAGRNMPRMPAAMSKAMDLNDVDFDAFLANDRTLDDPEIIRVERGARIRLRVINGASSTNFHFDLGPLQGTVVAVDGNPTRPLVGRRFELAMAQRMDILVDLPKEAGVWPLLAVREGDRQRTGIVLAAHGVHVGRVPAMATEKSGAVTFDQELRLSAATPLTAIPSMRTSCSP